MASTNDRVQQMRVTSEQAILQAKQDLDSTISRYVAVRQVGGEGDVEALRIDLHKQVLELYWRMREHLRGHDLWSAESAKSEPEKFQPPVWQGRHPMTGNPVTITWISDLDEWIDKTYEHEQELDGPYSRTAVTERPLRLPAKASIQVADLLFREFHSRGWNATDGETPADPEDAIV